MTSLETIDSLINRAYSDGDHRSERAFVALKAVMVAEAQAKDAEIATLKKANAELHAAELDTSEPEPDYGEVCFTCGKTYGDHIGFYCSMDGDGRFAAAPSN